MTISLGIQFVSDFVLIRIKKFLIFIDYSLKIPASWSFRLYFHETEKFEREILGNFSFKWLNILLVLAFLSLSEKIKQEQVFSSSIPAPCWAHHPQTADHAQSSPPCAVLLLGPVPLFVLFYPAKVAETCILKET